MIKDVEARYIANQIHGPEPELNAFKATGEIGNELRFIIGSVAALLMNRKLALQNPLGIYNPKELQADYIRHRALGVELIKLRVYLEYRCIANDCGPKWSVDSMKQTPT